MKRLFKILLVMTIFMTGVAMMQKANAQGPMGTMSITVEDSTGDRLGGASIEIVNSEASVQKSTSTNSNGEAKISLLPPGQYLVIVSLQGFSTVATIKIVQASMVTEVNIVLQLGSMSSVYFYDDFFSIDFD